MSQALNVIEITSLIRQELRGSDLKSMVCVCHHWWKAFGPYLWEKVYIDTDPDKDDRQVIFRNGLAAQCLTLSIYDAQDTRGVVRYVADTCRNVHRLHLKLFSPDVVVVRKNKILDPQEQQQQQQQQERDWATREETDTGLLDQLLSQLSLVSEVTISIAHEDIQPEVLWCITSLHNLRKLTVYGGLPVKKFLVRKNKRCNWGLITQVISQSPYLESLVVGWNCPPLPPPPEPASAAGDNSHIVLANTHNNAPIPSLRSLNVCLSNVDGSRMDLIYPHCPNLRELGFQAVKISDAVLRQHIQAVTRSCPKLQSFKYQGDEYNKDHSFIQTFLDGPLLNLSSLSLCLGRQDQLFFKVVVERWITSNSLSVLRLDDISNYELLFKVITLMTGISRLKLAGLLRGRNGGSNDSYGYKSVQKYYDKEKYSDSRLPEFGSKDTLEFLDVTHLDFNSLKCHHLFFDRVQNLTRLKRLEISHRQVQDSRLEETWSDPDEDPNLLSRYATTTTTTTTTTTCSFGSMYPDKVIDPQTISKRQKLSLRMFGVAYVRTRDVDYCPE
ncbi:hypothetical protein BGZ65_008890, partial [Modicella reniformis]